MISQHCPQLAGGAFFTFSSDIKLQASRRSAIIKIEKAEEVTQMLELMLTTEEIQRLAQLIREAEQTFASAEYHFDPDFVSYSCSCTAHKMSCGWD